MFLAKSKNFKLFICALACSVIVLSPTFSAPQRVEASAGALAVVATVGIIAIGLTYLYGTGLTSRIVEKCKQSDFAQYVVNIGNKAIQYGTGVGIYSVAQRTVNDLVRKGVSSSTISATTEPSQAMALLTDNSVAVKPTSSEITTIVNSIPANTYVDNPSYYPKSTIFKPFILPNISSFRNYGFYLDGVDISHINELYLRLSDFVPVIDGAIPIGIKTYNGSRLVSDWSSYSYMWRINDYKTMVDSYDNKLIYPSNIINGIARANGGWTYPCHIDLTTGVCDIYEVTGAPNIGYSGQSSRSIVWVYPTISASNGKIISIRFDDTTSSHNSLVDSINYFNQFYATYPPTNVIADNNYDFNKLYRAFCNKGCYLVDVSAYTLAPTINVKASDITTYFGSGTRDIYEDTPSLNINKVSTDVAQPDIHVKLSDTDTGDNVYLPIVTDVAIDGFTVSTDTVVDTVQDTIPDEVIDNIDASLDDYVAENPTDTNVVVDTTGIVTSIDYVTQAIEDSNYHKGFTVPNFNIDVPEYDSNFLSRWGKWIEFTRGIFNGLAGTEITGIITTSVLILIAVAVFRKVL